MKTYSVAMKTAKILGILFFSIKVFSKDFQYTKEKQVIKKVDKNLFAADRPLDLREQCRSAVGGRFLDVINEIRGARTYLEILVKKSEELKKKKKLAIKNVTRRAAQVRKEEFNVSHEQQLKIAKGRLDHIKEIIAQIETEMIKQRSIIAINTKKENVLRKSIRHVFRIKKKFADRKRSTPVYFLEYKSKCGRYRSVCPLPVAEARLLRDVFGKYESPLPCQRYSQVLSQSFQPD